MALAPGCILRGHAPASTQFAALPGVLETRSPSSRQSPEQVAAALWKRTRGHQCPAGTHALVPEAGDSPGPQLPEPPGPRARILRQNGREGRPPAVPTCTAIPALPATRVPRTAARLPRGASRIFELGLLHLRLAR